MLEAAKERQGKCLGCNKEGLYMEFAHFERGTAYVSKNGRRPGMARVPAKLMELELAKGRFLCTACHKTETDAETKALYGGKAKSTSRLAANKRKKEKAKIVMPPNSTSVIAKIAIRPSPQKS
jgi:hypothetical protein